MTEDVIGKEKQKVKEHREPTSVFPSLQSVFIEKLRRKRRLFSAQRYLMIAKDLYMRQLIDYMGDRQIAKAAIVN